MERGCDGLVKVKSSVEYLCGLLQALGINALSPEHIRRAKFNHPSAAPPLLHALHHLVALISSSPPPLDLKIALNSNRVPSHSNILPCINPDRLLCHVPEASPASSSSSCSSEQNGNCANLLVHQKKKKNKACELKHASTARLSTFIPSPENGGLDASLCERNSNLKSFTRFNFSFTSDAGLDQKTLATSSSSFDCGQGKSKHSRIPDLERDSQFKCGSGDHAKSHDRTCLISHRGRGHTPNFANSRNCNSNKLSRPVMSYKGSNGEALEKYGSGHTASTYGNGKAPHGALTDMDVLSKSESDAASAEPPISYASRMMSSLPFMHDYYEVQNGANSSSEETLLQGSLTSFPSEQHPIEDANEKLDYVKFFMAQWGYPDNLPVLAISSDAQQSQSLLLAMAWTLARFKVFSRTLMCQVEPLILSRSKAPLPPYPADVSFTREALAIGKQAEDGAHAHVCKLLHSLDSVTDVKMRVAARTQQALMLYGKVTKCIKNIHSLRLCKARLHHELDKLQMEKKILHPVSRGPLSQYELHLLQHKEELQVHLNALHAEKVVNKKMRELQKHESLFQEWMESVIELSVGEGSWSDVVDIEIMDFKQQLHRQEQGGKVCEVSLVNQADMSANVPIDGLGKVPQQKDGVKTLEPNVSDMYVEPILTRMQLTAKETVGNSRAYSITEKIGRLTYLATGVNQVLNSTHCRAMLHEALGPVLNDRSQFLFGL